MTNHPNRSPRGTEAFLIGLSNGRLWKPLGASQPSVFSSVENARKTIAGFSGRGALAGAKALRVIGTRAFGLGGDLPNGQRWIDGYIVEEA